MRRRDLAVALLVVAGVLAVALARSASRSEPSLGPVPRLVDLGAGRCLPCRRMAPILDELRGEYAGRAEIVFIDVWEEPERAERYRFRAIPTQVFYDRDGREVWRHEGFLDRAQIMARLRELGVER